MITDVNLKRRTFVEPITQSTNTAIIREDLLEDHRRRFAACAIDPTAERSSYHGYEVVITARERTSTCTPDQRNCPLTIRSESWKAPDLNCAELKRVVTMWGPGENPVVVSTLETKAITLGEPDPSLFAIPSGYIERKPSEVAAELSRIKGVERNADGERIVDEAFEGAQRPFPVQPK